MPCGTKTTPTEWSQAVSFDYLWSSTDGSAGSWGNSGPINTEVSGKWTYGQCIPNYHKRKNAGELLPHTAFRQFEFAGKVTPGSYSISSTYGGGDTITNYSGGSYPYCGTWLVTEEDCLEHVDYDAPYIFVQGAAARIYSGGHDMLTFIAELGKTRKMFANIVRRVMKGDFPKKPDELFGVWLAGRYGVRTTLYDLIDLNEAVKNLDSDRTRFSERTGSTTTSYSEEVEDLGIGGGTYQVLHKDEIKVSTRGSVVADMEPPTFQFNPVVTGWELLPFSFIADWIVHVGMWLEAMSFLLFAKDYQASGGQFVHFKRTSSCVGFTPAVEAGVVHSGNVTVSAQCEAKYQWRQPMRVPLEPQVQADVDNLKIMDLISIMRQAKVKAAQRAR